MHAMPDAALIGEPTTGAAGGRAVLRSRAPGLP